MYGQWWAHLLNLGYLLPKEHIKSHLQYTYARNYVPSFDPSKFLLFKLNIPELDNLKPFKIC